MYIVNGLRVCVCACVCVRVRVRVRLYAIEIFKYL